MEFPWEVHSEHKLKKIIETAKPTPGLKLSDHLKIVESRRVGSRTEHVVEFIGSDDFAAVWYNRQRFEVDAGRLENPILYTPLFSRVSDPSLPKSITIYRLGPAGVIVDEVLEGGEVKFVTITSSEYSLSMKHWAVGLEYNKDLVVFNELWNLPIIERQVGRAINARLNHMHLYPFISYTYGAGNQTAAASGGDTIYENILLTLENAVTHAATDTTNPRRGPYYLLVSTSMLFKLEHALTRVNQQGFSLQSSVVERIRGVIAYDGWTGTRGKLRAEYGGVSSTKGYLVSTAFSDQDHQSYEKQPFQSELGESDMSRFILESVIWDGYMNVYVNPGASTEEITWPTS